MLCKPGVAGYSPSFFQSVKWDFKLWHRLLRRFKSRTTVGSAFRCPWTENHKKHKPTYQGHKQFYKYENSWNKTRKRETVSYNKTVVAFFEVNIRISQLSKVMCISALQRWTSLFSGWQILMLTSKECINCIMLTWWYYLSLLAKQLHWYMYQVPFP